MPGRGLTWAYDYARVMSSASYLLLGFWDINKTQKKRKHKRTKKLTANAQCTNKRKKNLAQNVTPHKKPTNKRTRNVKKNVTSRKKPRH